MIKIGALWNSTGKPLATGKLGQYANLVILPNSNKQSDKSPDYWVFIAEDERKEGNQAKPEPDNNGNANDLDDTIPF